MSTKTSSAAAAALSAVVAERHLAQPTGNIALQFALLEAGAPLNERQRSDLDAWKRMVGATRICAYDRASREGWWLVDREAGEEGWFRWT
jgi:hypothetical protein